MKKKIKYVSQLLCFVLFFSLVPMVDSSSAQDSIVSINFQDSISATPQGFLPDSGDTYGERNGYLYGWNEDHTDLTSEWDVISDQKLDTGIHFHQNGEWNISLPNGYYDVLVSVGDAVYESLNTINVEGLNYWENFNLEPGHFEQRTHTINVSDGKLSVDHGNLIDGQTSLNYIHISLNSDFIAPSTPQHLQSQNITDSTITIGWDESTDNTAVQGYAIYRDDVQIATVTSSVYAYVDSDLLPETTYKYEVSAFDFTGNISMKSDPIVVTTASTKSQGIGLKGEYYSGTDFSQLSFSRLDPAIDFDWGGGSPDGSLDKDSFSIRWTGMVLPEFSELYTFYTETHGGARLWVNDQLLVDQWNANGMTYQSGTVALIAGESYEIKMEYKEDLGSAQTRLLWSSASQGKEIIPESQLNPPFIPNAPAITSTNSTSTTITLSWQTVTDATGYDVEVDGTAIDNGVKATYTDTNLAPNSSHQYRVRAKTAEVTSAWSAPTELKTKIAAPQNVQASFSGSAITVTWDEVSGADSYEIEVDGTLIDNDLSTVYIHDHLMPNSTHAYRIRAKNIEGASDWTQLLTKTVMAEIPTNLRADVTSTSVTLSWDAVFEATGYEIEADGTIIANGNDTIFVHNGLMPNTLHKYRVRALKVSGPTEWSAYIAVTTYLEQGKGIGLTGKYFDSSDLTEQKNIRVDKMVDFDWKNNSPISDISGKDFSIQWTGQIEPRFSENYTISTEAHGGVRLWINGTLLIDDWNAHNQSQKSGNITLIAGKKYDTKMEYRETNGVARVKLYWESPSQIKEIVPQSRLYPIGVPQLISSSSTETSVTLQWEPVSFAKGYYVEVDGIIVENGLETSYTESNLMPGTLHTYRVRAKNSVVDGDWSASVSQATLLGKTPITNLEPTETAIAVSWEPVVGAESYDIEADGRIINNGNQTNFMDSDLLSGTVHHYRVRARTQVVTGDWSDIANMWTLPDIPKNLSAASTSDSILLNWDAVRGATGYEIEANQTIMSNGDSTTFLDSGLNPNTQHTYRARARNSSGVGKWTPVFAKATLPATPQNLRGSATDTDILVAWDLSAGATAYDLEIDGFVLDVAGNNTYLHAKLLPNSTHVYRVRAKNPDGASYWSERIQMTTLPSIPMDFSANATSTQITLSWDNVDGATGYDLDVDGAIIDIGNLTMYSHIGLEANSEHSYRVRAKNGTISGNWSGKITVITLPGIPLHLAAIAKSTEITLSWDTVIGASGYDVEADGKIIDNGMNSNYVDQGLIPNSQHTYRVRAKNAGGAGDWSEPVTAETKFGTPQNLTATSTDHSITLKWDTVEGASGYDVFVDGRIVDNNSSTSFEHSGLEPYSWHVYRVRAKSADVTGEWSEALTQATLLARPAHIKTNAENTQITVTWDEVSGATGYDVEVDGVVLDNGAEPMFIQKNLAANTTHLYRIRAKNDEVMSEWSEMVGQMTTSVIPMNLKATATTNSITLTWDAVQGAMSYDIEADGKLIGSIQETTYTQGQLRPNTIHVYRVRANSNGGSSPWSDKLNQRTTPEIKVNVGKDTTFNFLLVAPAKSGVTERKITVVYNPDELEVIDLSAVTPEVELAPGLIAGTFIKAEIFEPGRIVYILTKADKTAVNSIKFKAKTNDYSKITYMVE